MMGTSLTILAFFGRRTRSWLLCLVVMLYRRYEMVGSDRHIDIVYRLFLDTVPVAIVVCVTCGSLPLLMNRHFLVPVETGLITTASVRDYTFWVSLLSFEALPDCGQSGKVLVVWCWWFVA